MRSVLALSLVLLAAPAVAQPAYVGRWTEIADKRCSEPLSITATTMEAIGDDSWQCDLPRTSGPGPWVMRMSCGSEGIAYRQTQTWALTGDTLADQRLTVRTKTGPVVYRRCGLSKAGKARRS